MYGHIRCIYTVLANPGYTAYAVCVTSSKSIQHLQHKCACAYTAQVCVCIQSTSVRVYIQHKCACVYTAQVCIYVQKVHCSACTVPTNTNTYKQAHTRTCTHAHTLTCASHTISTVHAIICYRSTAHSLPFFLCSTFDQCTHTFRSISFFIT